MATWVPPMSTFRVSLRLDFWNLTSKKHPLCLYRNLAMSTPYSETTPMIALRQHPIPTTPLDPSIFEMNDEEYDEVSLSLHRSDPLKSSSAVPISHMLAKLVKAGRFEEADRVKAEMIQMGLKINLSDRYEEAAINVLMTQPDREQRFMKFLGWISLISHLGPKQSLPRFDQILYLLLEKLPPDFPLITQFAIICASKGYTQTYPQRIIPFVIHFAHPSVSLAFMYELHEAALASRRFNTQKHVNRWYAIAIRGFIISHRLPCAIQLSQYARSHGVILSRYTLDVLHRNLQNNAEAHSKPRSDTLEDVDLFPRKSHDSDLPMSFQRLWRVVGTKDHPSSLVLSQFLDDYLSIPDGITAIQSLRRKAHRGGINYRQRWAMAEMLYYEKRRQWAEVLSVFSDYFYPVGVPQELNAYKKIPSGPEFKAVQWREKRGLQARLFPQSDQTRLVWRALVEITHKTTEIARIYQQLLLHTEAASYNSSYHLSIPDDPRHISVPPSLRPDATHFTPFLSSLSRRRKTTRMMDIFADMNRLHIHPTLFQMGLLAGGCALRGLMNETFAILDTVEKEVNGENNTAADIAADVTIERYLALYLPAFFGFLRAGRLHGAREIRDRLFKYGYVKGSNKRMEENLTALEQLESSRKRSSYK